MYSRLYIYIYIRERERDLPADGADGVRVAADVEQPRQPVL